METKRTESRYGWREALATVGGGAAFCVGAILLCSEPANDGPITWEFILLTKVTGFALLLLTGWIYKRFICGGGDGDEA